MNPICLWNFKNLDCEHIAICFYIFAMPAVRAHFLSMHFKFDYSYLLNEEWAAASSASPVWFHHFPLIWDMLRACSLCRVFICLHGRSHTNQGEKPSYSSWEDCSQADFPPTSAQWNPVWPNPASKHMLNFAHPHNFTGSNGLSHMHYSKHMSKQDCGLPFLIHLINKITFHVLSYFFHKGKFRGALWIQRQCWAQDSS